MSDRKIFVGGLRNTTEESLKAYFEAFGEVTDATLNTYWRKGILTSRGFGYVTFAVPSSVTEVMRTEEHMLDDRKIYPKPLRPKPMKVCVLGITPEITEAEIHTYFSKYGKIMKLDLPFDKKKRQRCPFCFIKFESEEIANKVLTNTRHYLDGKAVDVKKAIPKDQQEGNSFRGRRCGQAGGPGGQNISKPAYGDDLSAPQVYAGYGQQYGDGNDYGQQKGNGFRGQVGFGGHGGQSDTSQGYPWPDPYAVPQSFTNYGQQYGYGQQKGNAFRGQGGFGGHGGQIDTSQGYPWSDPYAAPQCFTSYGQQYGYGQQEDNGFRGQGGHISIQQGYPDPYAACQSFTGYSQQYDYDYSNGFAQGYGYEQGDAQGYRHPYARGASYPGGSVGWRQQQH